MRDEPHECQEPAIDENAALAGLDGDRELLRELAIIFCEDAPEVAQQLKVAVARGDAAEARRAAHGLKGLMSTFYAKNSVELAQRLEEEASRGQLDFLRDGGDEMLEAHVLTIVDELKRRDLT